MLHVFAYPPRLVHIVVTGFQEQEWKHAKSFEDQAQNWPVTSATFY